ncbi:pilus assembly protein [Polaromonas sp.]|nr:pilus assembly protein [Polaromonas sp.]
MTLHLRYPLLASLGLICSIATASGLQVSPVLLSVPSTQKAQGVWLSNNGDALVRAQVRVYRWTQEGGEDKLTPSAGLTVSPPMLQLAVGERQLIRAVRLGAAPSGPGAAQEAYRIVIDELPAAIKKGGAKDGLSFLVSYSMPVFVEPAGPAAAPPQLSWKIRTEGEKAVLEVSNSGAAYAQIGVMSFTDAAGHRTEISAGLMGYVLPGAQMRWPLESMAKVFADGGTLQAVVNKKTTQELIAPAHAAQ